MIKETWKHIDNVRDNINMAISALKVRAMNHDQSKLRDPERSGFEKVTSTLKGLTYGSNEYTTQLKKMKPFLDHHYAKNRHHPEHHDFAKCPLCLTISEGKVGVMCEKCGTLDVATEHYGIHGMNLIDMIEMLMDWAAATKRHDDGDILKSIEINQKRFGYTNELKQIFINTVKVLNLTD